MPHLNILYLVYKGLLDLPGGTIEFDESPKEALERELVEEVGIKLTEYDLIDSDSVSFTWEYNNNLFRVHHIGIFYKIKSSANKHADKYYAQGMDLYKQEKYQDAFYNFQQTGIESSLYSYGRLF